jgi:hypothetical protein
LTHSPRWRTPAIFPGELHRLALELAERGFFVIFKVTPKAPLITFAMRHERYRPWATIEKQQPRASSEALGAILMRADEDVLCSDEGVPIIQPSPLKLLPCNEVTG